MKNNIIIAALLLFFSQLCFAKNNWEEWRVFENAYFTMYTDANDKKAMHLFEELEKFRILMQVGLKVKIPDNAPKTIVFLFNSSRMFKNYQYNNNIAGYLTKIEEVPIIVMPSRSRGLTVETVIKHEYVHAVQNYDTNTYPLWVTEGIAELFSTAEYHENYGLVGSHNKDRWEYLYREINYDKIVQDDFNSLKRTWGADAYAQYWLLVNYSMTHDNGVYRASFGNYLNMYRNGEDSLESFKKAYGKSPDELADEAMSNYRRRSYSYNRLIYPLDLNEMDLDITPRQPEEGLVERLMLRLENRVSKIKEEMSK